MAGHSKWANIKHRKAKADAGKGRLFTRLSREIIIAVKQGGPDPDANFKLKMSIQKARANNVPADSIARTIRKASGEESSEQYEELIYEGYAVGGVAVLVEAATDNRNRTASEVRYIFSKRGGSLGEAGCVAWMFQQKGKIVVELTEELDEDSLMALALDAGAEDIEVEGDTALVLTEPGELESVQTFMEENGVSIAESAVERIPQTTVEVGDSDAKRVMALIENLEENEDVTNVYANYEIQGELPESED